MARFQAIQGKSWNHPVIAHGKLLVRNGEEAACFQLEEIKGKIDDTRRQRDEPLRPTRHRYHVKPLCGKGSGGRFADSGTGSGYHSNTFVSIG